ncbi:MAG: type II secretion system protein [Candidatus Gastranaerophilaceae bacterium]|nr:type II secretion system protein [Candidatus Gastranaerophilaceae bacterium]
MNDYRAFTLAEVLITLGIIGVVAAMTLPTLITNYKEKQTVSQLKKVYSALSQAWLMMENDYGSIDEWGLTNTSTGQTDPETGERIYDRSAQSLVAQRLKPHLKIIRDCKAGEVCDNRKSANLAESTWSDPSTSDTDGIAFWLNDGTLIRLGYYTHSRLGYSNDEFPKIDISVTLPGRTIVTGKNQFVFEGHPHKIQPEGLKGYNNDFDNVCKDNNGRGCTAWVIVNENLDYLHCRDKLSWTGKSSCK